MKGLEYTRIYNSQLYVIFLLVVTCILEGIVIHAYKKALEEMAAEQKKEMIWKRRTTTSDAQLG